MLQLSKEFLDLVKSWFVISLIFSIFQTPFFLIFLLSSLTVGLGFIGHELMHKLIAKRYGAWAEYRSDDKMLMMSLLISFTGFIFIAPGAVIIRGKKLTKKQNGLISLAGPLTNINLSLIFLYVSNYLPFFSYGYVINAWLALFNLIPFGNFDGRKVFDWNKTVWVIFLLISIFLTF